MLLGVLIADLQSRMASGDSVFIMSMLVGKELFEYTFKQHNKQITPPLDYTVNET